MMTRFLQGLGPFRWLVYAGLALVGVNLASQILTGAGSPGPGTVAAALGNGPSGLIVALVILVGLLALIGLVRGVFVPVVVFAITYFWAGPWIASKAFAWVDPRAQAAVQHIAGPALVYFVVEVARIFAGIGIGQLGRLALVGLGLWGTSEVWQALPSYASPYLFFRNEPGALGYVVATLVELCACTSFVYDAFKHQPVVVRLRQQYSQRLAIWWQGLFTADAETRFVESGTDSQGASRFMTLADRIRLLGNPEGASIILGVDAHRPEDIENPNARLWRRKPRGHVLVAAGARAGKGISIIIPTCLTYGIEGPERASLVVVDPRTEIRHMTARARAARGQRIYWITTSTDEPSHGFNLLGDIEADDPRAPLWISTIVRGLVEGDKSGGATSGNAYFDNNSQALVFGTIAALISLAHRLGLERPNLTDVMKVLLEQEEAEIQDWMRAICAIPEAEFGPLNDIAKTSLKPLIGLAHDTWTGITSSVAADLKGLNNPHIRRLVCGGEFRPSFLLDNNTTLYLNIDKDHLREYPSIVKGILAAIMNVYSANNGRVRETAFGTKEKPNCLMLIDELSQLGRFNALIRALPIMASDGLIFMGVIQSFAGYNKISGDALPDWFDNSEIMVFFGQVDPDSTKKISDMLGETTILSTSTQGADRISGANGAESATSSVSSQEASRALMTSAEIRALEKWQQLVLLRSEAPALLGKIAYIDRDEKFHISPHFAGRGDPNPLVPPFPDPPPMPPDSLRQTLSADQARSSVVDEIKKHLSREKAQAGENAAATNGSELAAIKDLLASTNPAADADAMMSDAAAQAAAEANRDAATIAPETVSEDGAGETVTVVTQSRMPRQLIMSKISRGGRHRADR